MKTRSSSNGYTLLTLVCAYLLLFAVTAEAQTVSISGRNGSGSTTLQAGSYTWIATLNTSGGGTLSGNGAASFSTTFSGPSTRTGSFTATAGTINLNTQMSTPQGVSPTVTVTFTFTGGSGGGGGGGGGGTGGITQADLDALEAALRQAIIDGDAATISTVIDTINLVQSQLQAQIDALRADLDTSQAAQDALIAALEAQAADFQSRIAALESTPAASAGRDGADGNDGNDGDSFGDSVIDYAIPVGAAAGVAILGAAIFEAFDEPENEPADEILFIEEGR